MVTQLTLTIDNEVVDSAKEYARESGRSLSDIVENYLKVITKKEKKKIPELSPQVKRLMGVIKLPDDFDYKKEIGEALVKKHL